LEHSFAEIPAIWTKMMSLINIFLNLTPTSQFYLVFKLLPSFVGMVIDAKPHGRITESIVANHNILRHGFNHGSFSFLDTLFLP
jgi:hypothetical protein